MEVIAAVELWQQSRRVAWIPQYRVKVDHAVEFTCVANPLIDLLAHSLFVGRVDNQTLVAVVGGVLKGWNGGDVDPDASLVGTGNQLTIAVNDVFTGHGFARRSEGPWESDVIDPNGHDDILHSRLPENVSIEAREHGFTEPVAKGS